MSKQDKGSFVDKLKEVVKKHNLKMTTQRFVIYQELVKSKDHPSADVIFKKVKRSFPNISFDTVYRTLLTFAEIGMVRVVEGYGDPKRFDPQLDNHHHFRCLKCNTIIDFYNEAFDSIKIPQELKNQFDVTGKKVVLEGLCEKCRRDGQ